MRCCASEAYCKTQSLWWTSMSVAEARGRTVSKPLFTKQLRCVYRRWRRSCFAKLPLRRGNAWRWQWWTLCVLETGCSCEVVSWDPKAKGESGGGNGRKRRNIRKVEKRSLRTIDGVLMWLLSIFWKLKDVSTESDSCSATHIEVEIARMQSRKLCQWRW